MSKHYEFDVKMACGGCSGAVTRALNKLDGIEKVDANLDTQKVDVFSKPELQYEDVLATIKKTGKEVLGGREIE